MTDERAVSSTLSYTLTLAITGILITGLLIAGGAFVSQQRESVVRTELRVVGQQVAADIENADRLVRAADTGGAGGATVRIDERLPERVAGQTYNMELVPNPSGPSELTLAATRSTVTVTVSLDTETPVGNSNAGGGPIRVRYTGSQLVISNG